MFWIFLESPQWIFLESPHWGDSNKCPKHMLLDFLCNILITKTCLYNFDPLKPHFYTVKLGFTCTGVYTIFLISAQNIDCGYSLEPPLRGGSNEYPQSMFWGEAVLTSTHNLCFEQKYEKYQNFLSENFHFLVVKFSVYLNRRVFVMLHNFSLTVRSLAKVSRHSNCHCNEFCLCIECRYT